MCIFSVCYNRSAGILFSMAQQLLMGHGLPIVEASRSHSDTPHSVGLLWTSDQPVAETYTWQHKTLKRDRLHAPCGIRTRIPSKRAAANARLQARSHRDRRSARSEGCNVSAASGWSFFVVPPYWDSNLISDTRL